MRIITAQDLGELVKAKRKSLGLTQPEVAAACGTGVRFIVDLEKGKPTCELGKSLRVVQMLGIHLYEGGSV